MTNSIQERRILALVAVLITFGIHYIQIRNQPEAVLTGVLAAVAISFITFEYYRSGDTKDIKSTVATIRMDQVKGELPGSEDEWVTEKKERVPLRGESDPQDPDD